MAFEPMYDEFKSDYQKKIAVFQTTVEVTLRADAEITKALAATADAAVTGYEALSEEARVNGRALFKALYLDSAGVCRSADYTADFTENLQNDEISPVSELRFSSSVIDIDTLSVSAQDIKVAAVIETSAFKHVRDEIRYFKGGQDLYTQKSEINFLQAAAKIKDEFSLNEEYPIKDKITQILLCEVSAYKTSVRIGADSVTVAGKLVTNLTYAVEEGDIRYQIFTLDFTEELAAQGARDGDIAGFDISVQKNSARLQLSEAGSSVIFDCVLSAAAVVYREASRETVTDAFSVTHEINVVQDTFSAGRLAASEHLNERIEGTAALDGDMPAIDSVYSVCGNRINVANAYAGDGKITLEGVINVNIIYYNAEPGSINSVSAELPFSVMQNIPAAREGMTVNAKAVIADAHARQRKAGEVDVGVSAVFTVDFYSQTENTVVKDVELGVPRDTRLTTFGVHIAREGEALWDVAKSMCATPELIISQNPSLKLPLAGGERILVYRRKVN